MAYKIPHVYLKDIVATMNKLDEFNGVNGYLWFKGPIELTDGETTYTLVNEDDTWHLDPDLTREEPPSPNPLPVADPPF